MTEAIEKADIITIIIVGRFGFWRSERTGGPLRARAPAPPTRFGKAWLSLDWLGLGLACLGLGRLGLGLGWLGLDLGFVIPATSSVGLCQAYRCPKTGLIGLAGLFQVT